VSQAGDRHSAHPLLLAHHPDLVAALRAPSEAEPWRVLVSGCLAGHACGVNGTDYGLGQALRSFLLFPTVRAVPFCPEDHGLGTPRTMPDLHGGDGFAAVDGKARVLDEHGTDLTDGMLAGARAMLARALAERVELAILTDMSAACGSQVISDGCRFDDPRRFQRGVGVATALLLRAGIPVVSQRDYKTVGLLRARLEPSFVPDLAARDHHESGWYVATWPPA
jgi:uncharacterized protein YbbK (DUF523 family)